MRYRRRRGAQKELLRVEKSTIPPHRFSMDAHWTEGVEIQAGETNWRRDYAPYTLTEAYYAFLVWYTKTPKVSSITWIAPRKRNREGTNQVIWSSGTNYPRSLFYFEVPCCLPITLSKPWKINEDRAWLPLLCVFLSTFASILVLKFLFSKSFHPPPTPPD